MDVHALLADRIEAYGPAADRARMEAVFEQSPGGVRDLLQVPVWQVPGTLFTWLWGKNALPPLRSFVYFKRRVHVVGADGHVEDRGSLTLELVREFAAYAFQFFDDALRVEIPRRAPQLVPAATLVLRALEPLLEIAETGGATATARQAEIFAICVKHARLVLEEDMCRTM
jgi:hypothetical protein